jgi:hypothetical protein
MTTTGVAEQEKERDPPMLAKQVEFVRKLVPAKASTSSSTETNVNVKTPPNGNNNRRSTRVPKRKRRGSSPDPIPVSSSSRGGQGRNSTAATMEPTMEPPDPYLTPEKNPYETPEKQVVKNIISILPASTSSGKPVIVTPDFFIGKEGFGKVKKNPISLFYFHYISF